MACKCGSTRILSVSGKVGDSCFMYQGEVEHEGYVLRSLGIGGGEYIKFSYCLDGGQIQDWNPCYDLEIAIEDYRS